MAPWLTRDVLEKARIEVYRDLWVRLEGISTFHSSDEVVHNLVVVQKQLQEWYYGIGGGLFIEGAVGNSSSSKAAFFAARDLRSGDPIDSSAAIVQHRLGDPDSDAVEDRGGPY